MRTNNTPATFFGSFVLFLIGSGLWFPISSSAQQNYYSVKFPDDRTIISCGGTADTSDMPVITYLSHCNFNVGISVKDQVFNLNSSGGCKKILRTWKLLYWCDYNPNWPGPSFIANPGHTDVGPTVIGNSINHGYLQYTQIIKIVDNVAPVYVECPTGPVLFCDYTNNDPAQYGSRCEGPVDLKMKVTDDCSGADLTITYRLYLDLDGNGSMETFRSSSAPGAWPIEKTISGDTVSARVVLPPGVGLPYGKHKIEWITNDGCGNEALCKYEFEVRDCKPPTVVCINGLSINIMQTGMISLWDTDFLLYTNDNCTPAAQIKIGIRKAGAGTGFPVNSHEVTFDCNEIGKQFVEIWAEDAYGNADYCTTYVIVQDNMGACSPAGPVTGTVSTLQNQPLMGAKILLKSNLAAIPNQSSSSTDAQGAFVFASAPGTCNYSIIPSLDTLHKAGLSTLDVLITDLHLSGQAPLGSPHQIIAADVNRDGQLNAADLDAMSDLILGNASTFPNNTAWRFVPSAFVFPNPAQPLSSAFPEKISTTCPLSTGLNQHFTAIKTGDVDGSFDVNSSSKQAQVAFYAERKRFRAGDQVEVAILSPADHVLGFQFTLEANSNLLSLQSVAPGTITPRLGLDLAQNRVAAAWHSTSGMESAQTVMILKFNAVASGTVAQALQMNSSMVQAEAYDPELQTGVAVLQFDLASERVGDTGLPQSATLQVWPNPTSGPVAATFFLPEAGAATLILRDVNGRTVATHSANFERGNQRLELPVAAGGVYFLSLQSATGTITQRVVVN